MKHVPFNLHNFQEQQILRRRKMTVEEEIDRQLLHSIIRDLAPERISLSLRGMLAVDDPLIKDLCMRYVKLAFFVGTRREYEDG